MHRKPRSSDRAVLGMAVVATALLATACSNAAETGIEELIEQQGGGDVDINSDDGSFSVQTEDGSMTVDENGNFVVTDENGETITGQAGDEEGDFSVESEDGSFSAGSTTELPEDWPNEIPEPDGLSISSATVIGSSTEQAITVTGSAGGPEFVDTYGEALQAAGYAQESTFESGETINRVYKNDAWTIGVVYFGDSSDNQATVSVYSSS